MMNWFIHSLKNYANFSGRANRREWWIFWFFLCLPAVLLVVLDQYAPETGENVQNEFFGLVLIVSAAFVALWGLGLLVPYLSVTVRRLHDIGLSAWWLLLVFVPIIGAIFFLAATLTRGNRAPNRFGTPPQPVGTEQAVALGNVSGEVVTSRHEKLAGEAHDEASRHDLSLAHGEAKSSEKLVRLIAGLAIALFAAVCALLFRYQTVTVQTAEGERTGTMDRFSGKISVAPFPDETKEPTSALPEWARFDPSPSDSDVQKEIDELAKQVKTLTQTLRLPHGWKNFKDWTYTSNSSGEVTIQRYSGTNSILQIPAELAGGKVVAIGDRALSGTSGGIINFTNFIAYKSIRLPNTLEKIGNEAFSGLVLDNLNIPDSVSEIGDNAFKDCKVSGRITLPARFDTPSEFHRIGLPYSLDRIFE